MINAYKILVGEPEGKRPLGRPRRRWDDIIKMEVRGIECEVVDWINLTQYRGQWRDLLKTVMKRRVP
jgi:hypothetical protein